MFKEMSLPISIHLMTYEDTHYEEAESGNIIIEGYQGRSRSRRGLTTGAEGSF